MNYSYDNFKVRVSEYKTQTKQKFQYLKQRLTPHIRSSMRDLSETKNYYFGNAKEGWTLGGKLAKSKNKNSVLSFMYKSGVALSKTKIRAKDVVPLISCALFSFTNPFVGLGIVGFALGRKFNEQIANCSKYVSKALKKLK